MTQEENKVAVTQQNNPLFIVIGALLVIIAVMGFFLGKQSATVDTNIIENTNPSVVSSEDYEELTLTVIDDKRCGEKCPTDAIVAQLSELPSVSNAEIIRKDFSDTGVSDYLKENEITALPLIVFSTKNFDVSKDISQTNTNGQSMGKVNTFLVKLPGGEFLLPVGSSFNPFKERSENGFLMLDKEVLKAIKENSYIEGNKDAKITWLEYSDLECPFCARLHNAGTPKDLKEKYAENLNKIFNHFPLDFHANAQVGSEILECVGEAKGSDAFYALMERSFTEEKSDKKFLIEEAVKLGVTEKAIDACLEAGTYTQKVKDQMNLGAKEFGVTGTPGNVLINVETGEYEVISGAYPTSAFEEIIDKLSK